MSLAKAFRELRKHGYTAKMNWWCCQSCGWAGLTDEEAQKAVFFHAQDATHRRAGDNFCLAWHGDGAFIVSVLNENGVKTEWDGSSKQRITVIQKG